MAKFIKTQGNFEIYKLDYKDCKLHFRVYPTFVCWDKDNIGNINLFCGYLMLLNKYCFYDNILSTNK